MMILPALDSFLAPPPAFEGRGSCLGKPPCVSEIPHAVEREAVRQKLLEQGALGIRDLLQHCQRKHHRAALLLHGDVGHAGVGEQHTQSDGRRKALK